MKTPRETPKVVTTFELPTVDASNEIPEIPTPTVDTEPLADAIPAVDTAHDEEEGDDQWMCPIFK